MTPQFVDLYDDGFHDIIAATYTGEVFICNGTKKGFQAPENIVDKDGEKIRIALYWDYAIERLQIALNASQKERCTTRNTN